MKRVLVTGASGFIGRHCLPVLRAKGYEIHGIYRDQKPADDPGVKFHHTNLLIPSEIHELLKLIRPSHLLHLAWYAVPGLYWTSQENIRWLEASQQLIHQFQSQGGERLVVAGTCAEYDWSLGTERFDEAVTPLAPATLYGQCKQSLERVIESLSRQSGISSACGRIFMLYGPYEHPNRLVSGIIRALLQRQPVPCSLGEQVRDVMYVKDVAAAFAALLDSPVSGGVNIASGEPLRVKDLIQRIALNLKGQSLIRFGERPMPTGEPQTLLANVHRLHNEVGWSPAYSLAQGLEETTTWWRRHVPA